MNIDFNPNKETLESIEFTDKIPVVLLVPSLEEDIHNATYGTLMTRWIQNVYQGVHTNVDIQCLIVSIFHEALKNSMEHGNALDPAKYVTVGIWFGKKGVLFAFRDEGDFYSLPKTKETFENRKRTPSTRQPAGVGGNGTSLFIQNADYIEVNLSQKTLYASYLFGRTD